MKNLLNKVHLLWFSVVIGALSQASCCYWSDTCKEPNHLVQAGVDCTKSDVVAKIPAILPQVLVALASGNWSTVLTALEVDGENLVACAVDKAVHDIGPQPTPSTHPTSMMAEAPAELQKKVLYAQMAANGQAYLTSKHVNIVKHAK